MITGITVSHYDSHASIDVDLEEESGVFAVWVRTAGHSEKSVDFLLHWDEAEALRDALITVLKD